MLVLLFELLIQCVGEETKTISGILLIIIIITIFRKCFEEFFIHKFRSTLSKSNVFGRGERVLIAYSGGSSSTALLRLIADGLSVNARKRLQFQAHVAFIDGNFMIVKVFSDRICWRKERSRKSILFGLQDFKKANITLSLEYIVLIHL